MKGIYYKLRMFKCNVRDAIRAGANRMKHPMSRDRAWDWSPNDHSHFCLAAKVLESSDFETVCPYHGKVEDIGCCDECDYCKYMAIVDFNTDKNGEKNISLHIKDDVKTVCE